ncbi:MAG: phosphoribosyltransferase family protein [Patescibacteria group bacterium]
MFTDRKDAGRQLAENLSAYRGQDAVVLALPRGGVVPGHEIAEALGLPLDIVVVRKVGHPDNPEYALCAVDETGTRLCNEAAAAVDEAWLAEETERQVQEAKRRIAVYRGNREPMKIAGKTALIVDDGIATGLSMRLAVHSARAQGAKRVVVAVPVAPPESVRELLAEGADDVVVLLPPEEFLGAVGAHYIRFEQVEDSEVIRLLRTV